MNAIVKPSAIALARLREIFTGKPGASRASPLLEKRGCQPSLAYRARHDSSQFDANSHSEIICQ